MKNIFLEKSINEIIALIVSKKINSNELLYLSKKIYKGDGKKYKVWNSFGIDKNYTLEQVMQIAYKMEQKPNVIITPLKI